MEGLAVVVGVMLILNFIFEALPPMVGITLILVLTLGGSAFMLYGFGLAFFKADLMGKALGAAVVTAIWILAGRPGLGIFKKKATGGSRGEHV